MKVFIQDSLRLLQLCGLNPINQNNYLKIITICIIFTFMIGLLALSTIVNWEGLISKGSATDLMAVWQVYLKVFTLLFNRKKFCDILNTINEKFWPAEMFDKQTRLEIEAILKLTRDSLKIMKVSYYVMVVCYLSKPILTNTKALPMPSYLFSLDIYKDPIFEILYAHQVFCAFAGVAVMAGFDSLFVIIIVYIICELKMVKEGFKRISILQNNSSVCFYEFKVLVEHHCTILKLIQDVNNCYSLLLLNQFLTSSLCVCGSLVVLSYIGFSSGESITYIVYMIAFLSQIFFFCAAGSFVAFESETVADTVFATKWWIRTQPDLRRGMVLTIMRSHKMNSLRGGGMVDLNFQSFTNIVRTGLSFFTLIKAVYSNTENKF